MMRTLVLLALFLAPLVAEDAIRVDLPVETKTTGAWRISKASVELPSGAVAPKLTLAPQPTQAKAPAPDSFVLVRFDINEKGLPINIQLDKSSDKELEGEVITLIRGWRFEAALRGDVPFVVAHAYIELSAEVVPSPERPPSASTQESSRAVKT
jgi:TonB family protein